MGAQAAKPDPDTPSDLNIPDNYVAQTLQNTKPLPPITLRNLHKELNYLTCALLLLNPILGLVGASRTSLQWQTAVWAVIYYFITGLGTFLLSALSSSLIAVTGITAGFHRLWAHRSYNASKPLAYWLALAGSGAAQGSIKWWSRGHRSHHRYTDTDLDPYNAHRGFFFSHIGWTLVKPRRRPGVADVSDLAKNPIVRWQHRNYVRLVLIMAFGVPTVVAGLGWGDWKGGFVYAGIIRLCIVHHVRLAFIYLLPIRSLYLCL